MRLGIKKEPNCTDVAGIPRREKCVHIPNVATFCPDNTTVTRPQMFPHTDHGSSVITTSSGDQGVGVTRWGGKELPHRRVMITVNYKGWGCVGVWVCVGGGGWGQ